MSTLMIHKKYQANLSPEQLFTAWISPDTLIPPVSKIEVEPKVDGHLKLIVETPDGASIMQGKFLTLSYPTQLVYTWQWNNDDEITQVAVDFKRSARGTEIVVIHSGFQSETSRATHDTGWDAYVAGVVQKLQSI